MVESDLAWKTDTRLACAGDREAFARLVRAAQGDMYRIARAMLGREEDRADAMQEAILNAYRGVVRLREPDYFRTWLLRILIHECRKLYRKRKREAFAHKLLRGGARGEAAEPNRDLDVREAVNALDEPLRTAVTLHYFADLSLPQIAEMTGVSEGTLKSRLHRARRQLAKRLNDTITKEDDIGYDLS